jgi:CheY-like chemotaxis protein
MFEKEGASVVGVKNGNDALTMVQSSIVEKRPFSLVILDIRLPTISGYDVARRMRDEGFKGVIAACTANATMEGKTEGLDAGVDLYFSKKVLKKDLVRALLERARDAS